MSPLFFQNLEKKSKAYIPGLDWTEPWRPPLTICGAATGAITGTIAHFNSLSPHFQQIWVRQAGFAGIPKPLFIVATIV